MVAKYYIELYLRAVLSQDIEFIRSIDECLEKKSIDVHSEFKKLNYGFYYDCKYKYKYGTSEEKIRYLDISYYKNDFSPITTAIYLNDISLLNYFLFEKKYIDLLKRRCYYKPDIKKRKHHSLLEFATVVGHVRIIKLFLELSSYPNTSLVYCIKNVINANYARKINKNKMKEIILLFANYLPYSLFTQSISTCKYEKVIKDVTKYAQERQKTILSLIAKCFKLPPEIEKKIFSFLY